MKTLFLDFDGTLHETARVYGLALRSVYEELTDDGLVPPHEITDEMICSWLGTPYRYPWDQMAPDLDDVLRDAAIREVGGRLDRLISDGQGRLFPGTEAVLDRLAADGWHMIILSNSAVSYMDMNRRVYGLDRWFSDYVLIGDYPHCPTKGAMLAEYLRKQADGEAPGRGGDAADVPGGAAPKHCPGIVVGDRIYDLDAAKDCGLPCIGCLFGYAPEGELDSADLLIRDIAELPEALETLLRRM